MEGANLSSSCQPSEISVRFSESGDKLWIGLSCRFREEDHSDSYRWLMAAFLTKPRSPIADGSGDDFSRENAFLAWNIAELSPISLMIYAHIKDKTLFNIFFRSNFPVWSELSPLFQRAPNRRRISFNLPISSRIHEFHSVQELLRFCDFRFFFCAWACLSSNLSISCRTAEICVRVYHDLDLSFVNSQSRKCPVRE
jgi:hypothetical protein